MDPLGFFAGGIVGAAACSLLQSHRRREQDAGLAGRITVVESRLSKRDDAIYRKLDALAKEQVEGQRMVEVCTKMTRGQEQDLEAASGRIEELAVRLDRIIAVQDGTLNTFAEQLQEMQSFIVKAAESARNRPPAVPTVMPPAPVASAPVVPAPVAPAVMPPAPVASAVGASEVDEFQQLLRMQQAAQQEFAARMRNEAAQAFQQPAGGGL